MTTTLRSTYSNDPWEISSFEASPYFSLEQQRAMCQFFEWRLNRTVQDWNQIIPSDPIWQRCFVFLSIRYKTDETTPSTAVWINRLAQRVLLQHKEKGDLKRFFCEHVLTNPVQIQEKLFNFINRMGLNQDAEYTCLIPCNPDCIVNCKLLTENLRYPITYSSTDTYVVKSRIFKDRLHCKNEMDLLLDFTFGKEEVFLEKIPIRSCSIEENFSAECESSIVLPVKRKALKSCIIASAHAAFSAKTLELYGPVKRLYGPVKRKKFVASVALAVTITITVFFFVKPFRF